MILGVLLAACTREKADDTGTPATGTEVPAGPVVDAVSVDCSDGITCFWEVIVGGGHASAADLYLTDLSADTDTAWSEHHFQFVDVTGAGQAQTLLLALDIGETPADYLQNYYTLYDLPSVDGDPNIGVAVMVKDDGGAIADCYLVHYDASAFAGTCP